MDLVLFLSELISTSSSVKPCAGAQLPASWVEAQTSPSARAEDHLPAATVAVHGGVFPLPAFLSTAYHFLSFPSIWQHPKCFKFPICRPLLPLAVCASATKSSPFPFLPFLQLIYFWLHTSSSRPTEALKSRSTSLNSLLLAHTK